MSEPADKAAPPVVGVGLVGYGTSGADLHAPLIGAEPRMRLRAVVSGRPDRVHRDLPSTPVVPTLTRLLDDPVVELVVVATPNATHHQLARTALLAGRHVVVDKPFVLATAEADELIALSGRQDRRLSVFHQRRWDSDYLTVQHCVRAGLLGRVSTCIARYDRFRPAPDDRDRQQPGVLHDLGPHLIDQALQLFGLPATVLADIGAQRPGAVVDDYLHIVLGYGALRVVLHAGSVVRAPGPRFEVHGDAGSYVTHGIDGQIAALLAGRRPGDPGWGQPDEDQHGTLATDAGGLALTGRLAGVPGAYETFYRRMAAAVRGEDSVPVAAEEARDTVRVIECALLSSGEGRAVTLR
jgi:scyllo-inositol 2-dehydrogenase (NADP+)